MTLSFIPYDLSPYVAARSEATGFADRMKQPQSAAQALELILQGQRAYLLKELGLENHPLLQEDVFPSWQDFIEVGASAAKKMRLAQAMMNGDPKQSQPVCLQVADYSRGIAEMTLELCVQQKICVDVWIDDPVFKRRLMIAGGEEKTAQFGELMAMRRESAQRLVWYNMNTPHFDFPDPEPVALEKIFTLAHAKRRDAFTPDLFYTTTRIPSRKMAETDGMAYEELLQIYFDMIDVDIDKIAAAHHVLIDKLDQAEMIRFINHDGTDLRMSIKGMTFVNSLMAKNVPGSEVFSAPVRDSVNGILVAKGRFIHPDRGVMLENITLEFEQGRVVRFNAEHGREALGEFLNVDEGMRYLGEVALGTNPALRRHVTNSLMVEKIGLSFHVALGKAYQYTDYLGVPVKVDNGNRSAMHWDITTMLYGKNGQIILDDEILMQDGFYIDPLLSYLNGIRE